MDTTAAPVLVVDEDSNSRTLIARLLSRAGFRVIEAAAGDEAIDAAYAERPAIVLLEVNLPGLNGYEVCSGLKARYGAGLPVVFLSGERTEPFDRVAGFLIGADDYVCKPFDPSELVARVRRLVARREISVAVAPSADDALGSLTPREQEVLRLLVDGRTQVEIAVELFISGKTVATHIQRVLGKLGVHSRAQAVGLAARAYALAGPA